MKYISHFIAFIIFTSYSFSQEIKVIEIIQAGTSIRNSIEYPGATILLNLIFHIIIHQKIHLKRMVKLYLVKEIL